MAIIAKKAIPKLPRAAKVRVRSMRAQVAEANSKISIPAMMTMAEAAEALRVSKPTVVRLVRRGELRTYRPTGANGVVLVHGDSVADHVTRNSFGGAR